MPTPFYYGNPDLYAQQLQLQRQQMLADQLQGQAQQPATPDNWNNMAVVPRMGTVGGLAKGLQPLMAAMLQKKVMGKQSDLYKQQMDYMDQQNADPTTGTNPIGLPAHTATLLQMDDWPQWQQMVQRVSSPTEPVLTSMQMGSTPDQRQAAEVARLHAQASAVLPTGPHVDPTNPSGPPAFTAEPPANTNPTMDASGTVSGVAPIPGANQAVSANNYSGALGTTLGSRQEVPTGNGATAVTFPSTQNPFLPQAGARIPNIPQGAPSAAPAAGPTPASPLAGKTFVSTNPTQAGAYADAGQRYTADRAAQQNIAQTQTGLENALRLVESGKFNSGPSSATKYNYLGIANTAGIPILKGDVNGYQSVQKYLANALGSAAAGSNLAGSNEKFETLMAGNPSAEHMGNAPLADAIRYVLSQQDAAKARYAYVSKRAGNGTDPASLNNAYSNWANDFGNGGARYFEAKRQPVATRDQAEAAPAGSYVNTPRGVYVAGQWDKPVGPPQ